MKVLVCISVVPDTTTKIGFIENNTQFNTAGVQYILNPYDELAVTRGLELAEANGGTVTIVHVGKADSEAVIRKALSMGANEAIRIDADPIDAQFVAAEIAKIAKGYDLIFTGRESIDYNSGLVAGLLAEMLQIPHVNVITAIEINDNEAMIERDIDGGREKLTCKMPLVVSAQKELTEPRLPNMRGIMAARTKPLQVIEPTAAVAPTDYNLYELPAPKAGCKMINADEAEKLIELLHHEAKVI